MCVFQWKTGHISERMRDTAKVTVNHYQKVVYTLSDEMKIVHLR